MSAYLEERSKYFTFSEIQISPKEEMEVSSLFLIIKAKLPARALHHQEKKNEYNINLLYIRPKFTLVDVYFTRE